MPDLDEPVRLVPHRPEWAQEAATEIARIAQAVSVPSAALEHIGSTAVPGLLAKPVIDLMLGVRQYPPSPSVGSAIAGLGYESLGEAGVAGRAYFRLRGAPSFNLHVVPWDGEHWRSNLALREYLRRSFPARRRYAQAKTAAWLSGPHTLLAYSAAKAAEVAQLLQEALADERGD
jgi:GrpB-like predicted nucleotidyltransferase (UPF0157 family)